jgi:hypothetical protein
MIKNINLPALNMWFVLGKAIEEKKSGSNE